MIGLSHAGDLNKELINASVKGNIDDIKKLLIAGADINTKDNAIQTTPIALAANRGHLEVVKFLFSQGAQIDAVCNIGTSALMIASAKGHLEVVRFLLNAGANHRLLDIKGFSALTFAASAGNIAVCKLLIDKGAIVDLRNPNGPTPLYIAAIKGNKGIVSYLLGKGADPNVSISTGGSNINAASAARLRGYNEIANLLENGY